MTSDFGVPVVAQDVCHHAVTQSQLSRHREVLGGLADVITELHARAQLLSQLLRSARGPSQSNGRIYVDIDAQAWFTATAMDCTAYPRLPDTGGDEADARLPFAAIHSHGTDPCTCFTTP